MKHFHLGAQTSTLVAGASGIVLAWRNASPLVVQYIKRFRAVLWPVTNPTANAELRLQMRLVTAGMGGNFTTGTDVSDITTANYGIHSTLLDIQRATGALQTPISAAAAGNIIVAATGGVNNVGGETFDTQAWSRSGMIFPAAASAQQTVPLVIEWKNMAQPLEHEDPFHGCIPLKQNTGFIFDLPLVLAAGFTASCHFEVDWCE